MSTSQPSLRSRHAELTRALILESAIAILCEAGADLTVRSAAQRAGISERTVFRHFENRDDLLDGVAAEMNRRLAAPTVPQRLEDLPAYPAAIFARFEDQAALIRATLGGEVYERVRSGDLVRRGAAIRRAVDNAAPAAGEDLRRLVAHNIHYHVIASTWHYYRTRFAFSAEETVAAARLAIEQAISGLLARAHA